jgi:hypothetical protein
MACGSPDPLPGVGMCGPCCTGEEDAAGESSVVSRIDRKAPPAEKHTPLPWVIERGADNPLIVAHTEAGPLTVAEVLDDVYPYTAEQRANAELIVRAVNSHADLLTALEQIAESDGDCEQQKFRLTRFQASQVARAAIHKAKAEGRP